MTQRVQAFDFSVDVLSALLWSHNEAVNLTTLLTLKQKWYDENNTAFWDDWYRDVFDVRTANDFGLSVWAQILKIPLGATLGPTKPTAPAWAFGELRQNFNRGNFGSTESSVASLTTEQARLLIRLRYAQLTVAPTVIKVNRVLKPLFEGQGKVYIADTNDMAFVTYIFDFEIGSQVKFILENFDVMPRPSAVGVKFLVFDRPVFGFGVYNQNWHYATFAKTQ